MEHLGGSFAKPLSNHPKHQSESFRRRSQHRCWPRSKFDLLIQCGSSIWFDRISIASFVSSRSHHMPTNPKIKIWESHHESPPKILAWFNRFADPLQTFDTFVRQLARRRSILIWRSADASTSDSKWPPHREWRRSSKYNNIAYPEFRARTFNSGCNEKG